MIKNATLYRIQLQHPLDISVFDKAIQEHTFNPCGATQELASGWTPPRGYEHGAMVELVGTGHLVMSFVREVKTVPGQAITRELDALVAKIEQEEGRKPGRKEKRELREIVVHKLLPHAFAKRTSVPVWIDPTCGLLVIGSTSTAVTDLITGALVRALQGASIDYLNTELAPATVMMNWLMDGNKLDACDRFGFCIGRDVELHSGDEMKTVVKYNRHHLDDEEMRHHIGQGKLPVSLSLDWNGRVSFTLTKAMQIKKIKFLDVVFEGQTDEHADSFDADWAITTGEMTAMIVDLIDALGGEMDREGGAV
jgi:recombination associated protein RdgC